MSPCETNIKSIKIILKILELFKTIIIKLLNDKAMLKRLGFFTLFLKSTKLVITYYICFTKFLIYIIVN